MKEIKIFILLAFITFSAHAQLTSLNEDFNGTFCPTQGQYYPNGWTEQNSIANTDSLAWHCTPTNGEFGTGGMFCTGYYVGLNHKDTAFFITPKLDIHNYVGNVYIQFDTKTDQNINSLSTLGFMPYDSVLNSAAPSDSANPPLALADVAGWVTHQVDVSSFKGSPFYFAFRYTSSNTIANTWYLDNVLLTGTPLDVTKVNREKTYLPLTVLGNSSPSSIILSYNAKENGLYDIAVYDMMGREVHKETIIAHAGPATYMINDLNLHNGMYLIRMGNAHFYGTAKTIVMQ